MKLLTIREFVIAIKPRARGGHQHRRPRYQFIRPTLRFTEQGILSLALVVSGVSGSLHFGTNLKVAPQLHITTESSDTGDQYLPKNTGDFAPEIKHGEKIDLIKPAAKVTKEPEPEQPALPPAMERSVPSRIRIPKIGVDTSLIPTGLGPAGSITMPDVFDQAMWYDQSPTPGERGPAVITGHVDSPHNIAVFWRLRELLPGDTVQIDRQNGSTATFVVTEIQQYAQDQFPTQAVYGNIDYAGLRLITCGGTFSPATGHYTHNTVVSGSLVP